MLRVYLPALPEVGATLTLSDEAQRHAKVKRLSSGDPLRFFDGHGGEVEAKYEPPATKRGDATATVSTIIHESGSPDPMLPTSGRVVLVQAVSAAAKLDLAARMATEAGAAEIILVPCERSTEARVAEGRLERICQQAARQCLRTTVPTLSVQTFEKVLRAGNEAALRVYLSLRTDDRPSTAAISSPASSPAERWFFVGPEGGLSAREEELLQEHGWFSRRLPGPVLRTETAAAVAVATGIQELSSPASPIG